MAKPSGKRVTNRPEPTKRWDRQQPADRLQRPIPLYPQNLREGEMATKRLSLSNEVDAGCGLGCGQTKHRHIRELPRDSLNRRRRPGDNEVRSRRAEPAISVKDQDVRRCGHDYSLPRESLDFASGQTIQHLTRPHP